MAGSNPAAVVIGATTYLYAITPNPTFFSSTDGLTFAPLPFGPRPSGATGPASLANAGGSLRMYFTDQASPTVVQSAIGNGTAFTLEPGTRGTLGARQQPKPPQVVALPGGGYRAYYRDQTGDLGMIKSARSDDGLTFTEEAGERLLGTFATTEAYDWGMPSVAPSASGFLMVVVRLPRLGGAPSLHLARSQDGLSWTVDPAAIQTGGTDPVLVSTGSDQFRLYYLLTGLIQSGSISR